MEELLCKRCGHTWVRRLLVLPKRCPKCTSVLWNQEKKKNDKANKQSWDKV